MAQCPKCKEDGSMVETIPAPVPIGNIKLTEYFCNICGHSWKKTEKLK
jgi:C4-type Zn-finger protein